MRTSFPSALILAVLPVSGVAQEMKLRPDRYAMALARSDLRSSTPAMARRSLHRIDRAATAVCGAPEGSLHELTRAVRTSACWRNAVNDAVGQIDAPLLAQAWQESLSGEAP
ncbi:UrcA family protein [Sphingomonas radiodurans]|uniref:UrcA family protein n=1 Tax=Sphingomonas radiodurans TaxID=2890321 RepID=UPI0038CDBF5E